MLGRDDRPEQNHVAGLQFDAVALAGSGQPRQCVQWIAEHFGGAHKAVGLAIDLELDVALLDRHRIHRRIPRTEDAAVLEGAVGNERGQPNLVGATALLHDLDGDRDSLNRCRRLLARDGASQRRAKPHGQLCLNAEPFASGALQLGLADVRVLTKEACKHRLGGSHPRLRRVVGKAHLPTDAGSATMCTKQLEEGAVDNVGFG